MSEGLEARASTGIQGFDQLVEGGLPAGRNVLICGGPGVGKTVFCIQYLHSGATRFEEPGVYVSLDEDQQRIASDMLRFGWDLEGLIKRDKLAILDAVPHRGEMAIEPTTYGEEEFSARGLVNKIRQKAHQVKAKRVAIDPLSGFLLRYARDFDRRLEIVRLLQGLSTLGCTTLLTTELTLHSLRRRPSVEVFAADGAVLLEPIAVKDSMMNLLRIMKMRRTSHDRNYHPYTIDARGITVFPEEQVFVS